MSYILQIFILVYICTARGLLHFLTGSFTRLVSRTQSMSSDAVCERANGDVNARWQKSLHLHQAVLQSLVIEFQEVQCLFMVGIQLAIFLGLNSNLQTIAATNLYQLNRNKQFSQVVAIGGIAPVAWGLWLVYRTGIRPWTTVVWSSACVVLSTITFYWSRFDTYDPENVDKSSTLAACGGHPPPLVYCAAEPPLMAATRPVSSIVFQIVHAACLGFYIVILVMYLWPWLRQRQSPGLRVPEGKQRTMKSLMEAILVLCLSIANILYFISLFGYAGGQYPKDWDFGQIMAVTVWVPILVKYLQWSFCKWSPLIEPRRTDELDLVGRHGEPAHVSRVVWHGPEARGRTEACEP